MKLIAKNIKWDIDKDYLRDLPKEMEIPVGMRDIEEISDYLSDETGYCHEGFDLDNMSNTNLYLIDFKYISDTSSHSSNIPDEICYQCLLESDADISEADTYKVRQDYRIDEMFDNEDANGITITKITLDELVSEYYDIEEFIYISKEDLERRK